MRLLLLAASGGAIGAGARHIVNVACLRWFGPAYPWSTLIVNVAGSLMMGFLVETIVLRYDGSVAMRTFLATGILGGFTTFSAFSMDVFALFERGATVTAFGYIAVSVFASIAALYAGIAASRGFFG